MAYYAGYAASISKESPFRLYSQKSFSCDLSCDLRIPDQSAPVQPKVVLQQHQQQQHQKHHLQQQLQQRVLQHTQSQQQRFNVTWSLVWCALLVTAIAGAMFAFAPLSYPSQSLTNTNLVERQSVMAPTAGTIKCQVSQGSSSVSSLCDGDLQFAGGVQQHITIWRQAAVAGAPVQSTASARLDDGSSSSSPWDIYGHRRRQQHRKLMRLPHGPRKPT